MLRRPFMNSEQYLSVSDINRYINFKFEEDINLQVVYLQGEISNFKYSGKHCYFSLKDPFSEISAMYFYPNNLDLNFKPLDGMKVQVVGKIQVYQKKGTYAIIVKKMVEAGIGLLYQQYLELKDKLEKEGLFDENKKLVLPEYPERIAVITASTGEAIRDIISTFNRRFPLAKIKLYPALVQGVDAPKDLIRALKKVYADNDSDVIIIGRGGGSFEDLACFNDETLARTLFASKIPTVSAVGHEGDYTICDFVASHRAPTPTGAAMLLSKDKHDIINALISSSKRLKNGIKTCLTNNFNNLQKLNKSYGLANFLQIITLKENNYHRLDEKLKSLNPKVMAENIGKSLNELQLRMVNAMEKGYNNLSYTYQNYHKRLRSELIIDKINHLNKDVDKYNQNLLTNYKIITNNLDNLLQSYQDKMIILNPFNLMKKGYSIVYKSDTIITSVKKLAKNDTITIKMADGSIDAVIK